MLSSYFSPFRQKIIGNDQYFDGPFGTKRIIYADWTASGRLYQPIEDIICQQIGPYVANTHTETNTTGSTMTGAYKMARQIIKDHVNASESDVLISSNSGMTGVVNKFQRILGLKIHENFSHLLHLEEADRPIVFVSHMEHHSNQTSWFETIAEVQIIPPCPEGKVDVEAFEKLLQRYQHRKTKIAAITSASNVTGVKTDYHKLAKLTHQYGGLCFVDFACSAPYIDIDMHPADEAEKLDAIYFSPHKFLGGPGGTGILIFDSSLYTNKIPDHPGGGTVDWTNPWGEHKYCDEIEAREDGGTPAFLQTIKVALSIRLKEKMGVTKILAREKEINDKLWSSLSGIPNLHFLADNLRERLGVYSFYIKDLHYNLGVKMLNDRFGIQVRGGCSCAGTYGHYLLEVSYEKSHELTTKISCGDLSEKPGWIRMSIHPTMTDEEIEAIIEGILALTQHHATWAEDYTYDAKTNSFWHKQENHAIQDGIIHQWFDEEKL